VLCDFHTHLLDEPNYAEALAEVAQNLGFDKLFVCGGEPRYGMASNEDVLSQAERYPDLFVAFAFLRLGQDGARDVEEMQRAGFVGLRLCAPPAPYDNEEFFPVYEAAAAVGMPVLFHTGFLPATPLDRALDVRPHRMAPRYLDTVARSFPALKIVGCGLGGPWYEEAVATLQHHSNVYFDLSGGAIHRKGVHFFRGLLSPQTSSPMNAAAIGPTWSKIIFGTAVRHEDIASVERDYQRLFRSLALAEDLVRAIMGETAASLLGLSEET